MRSQRHSSISKQPNEVCTYFCSIVLPQRPKYTSIGQLACSGAAHRTNDLAPLSTFSAWRDSKPRTFGWKKANMTRIIFRSRKLRTNTQPNFFGVSTFNPINFFSFSISFVRAFARKPHFIIKGGTWLLFHTFIVSTMSNTNSIQVGHDVSDFNQV